VSQLEEKLTLQGHATLTLSCFFKTWRHSGLADNRDLPCI